MAAASRSRQKPQTEPPMKPKSTITSRLRENEGKFIRQLEQKDQEIMELKKKLQELSERRRQRPVTPNRKRPTASAASGEAKWQSSPEKRQLEGMLKTLTNEKLHLERKLQLSQEQVASVKSTTSPQQPLQPSTSSVNEKINEKMLKTIRFKSTMCQKLEEELHQKEEEIVHAKSENFKLLKKLETLEIQEKQLNQKIDEKIQIDKGTNLEARVEQLEEWLKEGLNTRAESGYLSLPSTESDQKGKIDLLISGSQPEEIFHSGEDLSDITEVTEESIYSSKLYLALKDHNNPEHLSFQAGQLIRVHAETVNPDFVLAETGGIKGLCPKYLLSEIVQSASPSISSSVDGQMSNLKYQHRQNLKVALYDYDPIHDSPNADSHLELSFLAGDAINVYGDLDRDGFYFAELNGKRGLVPGNFVLSLPEYGKIFNKSI